MKTIIKKSATTVQKVPTKKIDTKKGNIDAVFKAMDKLRKQNVDLSYLKPDYE